MYQHETTFPVRYAETDQMGIVHHSVYPVWFECGRTEYVRHFGVSYAEAEALGAWLPLLRLTATYKIPARYGESVVVRTRLITATKARLTFGYVVTESETGRMCAEGTTEHAWTDPQMKPVNLAKYCPELFARMAGMYAEVHGE